MTNYKKWIARSLQADTEVETTIIEVVEIMIEVIDIIVVDMMIVETIVVITITEDATIEDAVDDLTSPEGQTNIPQGLGWAWRVLMPSAPFTEAIPDPPYRRQQAILLLTDGENVGITPYEASRKLSGGSVSSTSTQSKIELLARCCESALASPRRCWS